MVHNSSDPASAKSSVAATGLNDHGAESSDAAAAGSSDHALYRTATPRKTIIPVTSSIVDTFSNCNFKADSVTPSSLQAQSRSGAR